MKKLPFTLDHLSSEHTTEEMTDTLAEYIVELFLRDDDMNDACLALVTSYNALVRVSLEENDTEVSPQDFLEGSEAQQYALKMVTDYTGNPEDNPIVDYPVMHKPLLDRMIIAYLNRMRATQRHFRELHEATNGR